MNLKEIRDEVRAHFVDPGITDAKIDQYINLALRFISEEWELPGRQAVISCTSQLSQSYLNISTALGYKFYGKVKNIFLTDNKEYKLYNTLEQMMLDYTMDEAGSLEAFTVDGDILWYSKIPATAETFRILVTTYPNELVEDEDTPFDLPPHLHYKLLVNGSCYLLWSIKEDGVDGAKVNTNFHFGESFATGRRAVESGFNLLRKWIVSRKPPLITGRMWF